MDATQVPAQAIDPNAIKLMLAKLFSGAVQPGQPTFPTTPSGAPPALAATPAGMTQPRTAAAAPAPGAPAAPAPAPGPAQQNTPAGMTQVGAAHVKALAENKQPPGPTAGGLPAAPAKPITKMGGDQVGQESPTVLSQVDFNAKNPLPAHTPYVAPDLKHRMLMGLFAGMAGLGHPEIGAQMTQRYLENIQQNEAAEKNYPATAAAAQQKAYDEYLKNQGVEATTAAEKMREKLYGAQAERAARPVPPKFTQPRAETALGVWREQNPTAPIKDWLDLNEAEKAKYATTAARARASNKPAGPKSLGGMLYSDFKKEHPNSSVEDWYALQKAPTAKDAAALQKERDTVAKNYDAQLYGLQTDPAKTAEIQNQRDRRLKVYDRLIHNVQNEYRVGKVIDTPSGKQKITAIHPDGMLEVAPAGKQ